VRIISYSIKIILRVYNIAMNLEEFELEEKMVNGTNCFVYKGSMRVDGFIKDVVLKIEKEEICNYPTGRIVKKDYLNIRKKLSRCRIKIPLLYFCELLEDEKLPNNLRHGGKLRFVIAESFDGKSIRDLTSGVVYNETVINNLLIKCKSFIGNLPEDIPLDTNTGNFVYSRKTDELSFVDFLPPNPWGHMDNAILMKDLKQIFPTLKNLLNDTEGRKRYYLNDFRWEKFKFYLNKYSVTPQKLVLP
jgi:hypothetical protein